MKKITYSYLFIAITLLAITACKNDDTNSSTNNFDTQAMIQDITEDVMLPAIIDFKNTTTILESDITTFINDPTEATLSTAQNSWKISAEKYGFIYSFNIGRPKELFMHQFIFNWPAFTIAIDNILSTTDPIEIINISSKAKGLTGIEYLLFATPNSTNADIVTSFSSARKREYLSIITTDLKDQAFKLENIWSTTGENYANTFITNNGTGLDSSLNMLFNGIYNVAETIKKAKLGKPAGLENTSATNPESLQAFRSKISLKLIENNIKSIENVYFNITGLGLDEQIKSITKSDDINTRVQIQFDKIYTALNAIQLPLYLAIDQEKPAIATLYNEIRGLVLLLNNEVSSTLSIILTPTDNDGD